MHYVIIGGSASGVSCAESIRKSDKKSAVTLISEEDTPLYSRCLLSYYLAGHITDDGLCFKDKDFFKNNGIETILGIRAEKIDVKERNIKLSGGRSIGFDRLLLATGSRSKMLNIPGTAKKGVFALRNIKDANGIIAMLNRVRTVVVLGGGLIGLRAAYALKERGLTVKVVVKSGQILSQITDSSAANLIQTRIEQSGITVMKGIDAKEVIGGESAQGVLLDNGERLECELIIVGKGVEPNIELAKDAGIDTAFGITVNDLLQTSDRDIFAAGDVAETSDIVSGKKTINAIWPCAVEQGKCAAQNMTGKSVKYAGTLAMNSVEFFGLPAISIGMTRPAKGTHEELVKANPSRGQYKKIVLNDNVVSGFISVGRIEHSGVYGFLIKNRLDIGPIKDILLDENFSFASIAGLIRENKEKFAEEEFQDIIWTY